MGAGVVQAEQHEQGRNGVAGEQALVFGEQLADLLTPLRGHLGRGRRCGGGRFVENRMSAQPGGDLVGVEPAELADILEAGELRGGNSAVPVHHSFDGGVEHLVALALAPRPHLPYPIGLHPP